MDKLFAYLEHKCVTISSSDWHSEKTIQNGVLTNFASTEFEFQSKRAVEFWRGVKVKSNKTSKRKSEIPVKEIVQLLLSKCFGFFEDNNSQRFVLIGQGIPLLPLKSVINLSSSSVKTNFIHIFFSSNCPKDKTIDWNRIILQRNRREIQDPISFSDYFFSRLKEAYSIIFPQNKQITMRHLQRTLESLRNDHGEQSTGTNCAEDLFDWDQEKIEKDLKQKLEVLKLLRSTNETQFNEYKGFFNTTFF